jgi:hypothetical protein
MADSSKHVALTAEIAKLREQQVEDIRNATFVGWTSEISATHERRERHITELRRQLATLEG